MLARGSNIPKLRHLPGLLLLSPLLLLPAGYSCEAPPGDAVAKLESRQLSAINQFVEKSQARLDALATMFENPPLGEDRFSEAFVKIVDSWGAEYEELRKAVLVSGTEKVPVLGEITEADVESEANENGVRITVKPDRYEERSVERWPEGLEVWGGEVFSLIYWSGYMGSVSLWAWAYPMTQRNWLLEKDKPNIEGVLARCHELASGIEADIEAATVAIKGGQEASITEALAKLEIDLTVAEMLATLLETHQAEAERWDQRVTTDVHSSPDEVLLNLKLEFPASNHPVIDAFRKKCISHAWDHRNAYLEAVGDVRAINRPLATGTLLDDDRYKHMKGWKSNELRSRLEQKLKELRKRAGS